MKSKRTLLVIATLLLAPFVYGHGDSGSVGLNELVPTDILHSSQSETVDTIAATLAPMGDGVYGGGRLVHSGWYDTNDDYRQEFRAEVAIGIPSKALGIDSVDAAMGKEIGLRFTHHGIAYAECRLTVEPVVSRSAVHFALDQAAIGDDIKPNKGVCDVDLIQPGLQVGLPALDHGDNIKAFAQDKTVDEVEFLEGYCE